MDDLTLRFRAQYLERIIWIVIILVLLVALIVVYFQKCPPCEEEGSKEQEVAAPAPAPEPEPVPTPVPNPTPAPEPEPKKELSGDLSLKINSISCEIKATGEDGWAKIKTIGMQVDNQKEEIVGVLDVYVWDSEDEEVLKDVPITGDDAVRLGRIDAGSVLKREIRQTEIKTASIDNLDLAKNIKIDLREEDESKILVSQTGKFKVEGNSCKLV